MIKINFKKSHLFVLSVIIFVGGIFSIPSLVKPMIAEGDAYARVNLAVQQIEDGVLINNHGGMWLPLHSSLISLVIGFFNYPQLSPRVVSLSLSLLSVFSLYFYTENFTNNKNISLLSSFIFLVFPLRYFLSTQTLSEVVFVFFLSF